MPFIEHFTDRSTTDSNDLCQMDSKEVLKI